jgi:hypothetical protein
MSGFFLAFAFCSAISPADNPETRRIRTMTDKNLIACNRPPPDDVPGRDPTPVNPTGTAPGHDAGWQRPEAVLLDVVLVQRRASGTGVQATFKRIAYL